MSEQGLDESNTPVVAGPESGTGTAEHAAQPEDDGNWPKRYTDLQAEYTRMSQETAELRRQQELYDLLVSSDDEDTRRQVAERLGYVLEQEPDPELDDPLTRYDERLGRIEESLTQRQQDENDAAAVAEMQTAVEARIATLRIPKGDEDLVLAYAVHALPPTSEGLPDIEQAYRVFVARETERQREWAKGKRSAPHIAPNGQAATEVPNLDDRQQRQEWMVRRMQEND